MAHKADRKMCANLILSFEAMSGAVAYRKLKFGPFELSIGERLLRRDGVALPLGDRALDILSYLAERPGEVVAKRELMDHVWPDVTVEEGSLRIHVAAIRKALGDGQSGNRYIANIKGRGYSFVGTVVPLAGSTESGNDRSGQPGRLPAQPRRMIGRDPVIGEVSDKLRDERFVTLLGPGGIGKTTIALAVGRAAAEEFGGEVYLLDFASLTDPRHVAGAVATSLGLALKSKDPGLELVDLVRSRKTAEVARIEGRDVDAMRVSTKRRFARRTKTVSFRTKLSPVSWLVAFTLPSVLKRTATRICATHARALRFGGRTAR